MIHRASLLKAPTHVHFRSNMFNNHHPAPPKSGIPSSSLTFSFDEHKSSLLTKLKIHIIDLHQLMVCTAVHSSLHSKFSVLNGVQDQGNSDSVLDDVACLLSCTRTSLHGALLQPTAGRSRSQTMGQMARLQQMYKLIAGLQTTWTLKFHGKFQKFISMFKALL